MMPLIASSSATSASLLTAPPGRALVPRRAAGGQRRPAQGRPVGARTPFYVRSGPKPNPPCLLIDSAALRHSRARSWSCLRYIISLPAALFTPPYFDRRRLLKTFANLNAYFSKFTIFGDLQLKNLQEKSIKKRGYERWWKWICSPQ